MLPLKQPLSAITGGHGTAHPEPSPETRRVTRGVCRFLAEEGYGPLVEFRLPNRRRVDAIGLGAGGDFVIVEIKVSVADFRSDNKWPNYLPYCDRFYFAVPPEFPRSIIPDEYGLIVADGYGAAIRREAPEHPMTTQRRKRQQMRFALTAADRLQRLTDPRV